MPSRTTPGPPPAALLAVRRWNGGTLRPWPKGVSGNPSGRPKSKPITDACRRILGLSTTALAEFRPKTGAEKLAWAMIQKAWSAGGSVAAAKEVTDRVEGTPIQAVYYPDEPGEGPSRLRIEFTPSGPRTVVVEPDVIDVTPAAPAESGMAPDHPIEPPVSEASASGVPEPAPERRRPRDDFKYCDEKDREDDLGLGDKWGGF